MNVIAMLAKKLGIYLSAVLAAYILASASATQHVVASLSSMGVAVSPADRLSMTLHDFLGMSASLLPLVAFGLLAAFLVTALLCRWLGRWRTPLYVLAGATALVAIHALMNLALGLTPVAIGRSAGGLLVQGLAGAAGGYVYIRLNQVVFSNSLFELPE